MYLHNTNMNTYELLYFVNEHTIDIRKGQFHHYFTLPPLLRSVILSELKSDEAIV